MSTNHAAPLAVPDVDGLFATITAREKLIRKRTADLEGAMLAQSIDLCAARKLSDRETCASQEAARLAAVRARVATAVAYCAKMFLGLAAFIALSSVAKADGIILPGGESSPGPIGHAAVPYNPSTFSARATSAPIVIPKTTAISDAPLRACAASTARPTYIGSDGHIHRTPCVVAMNYYNEAWTPIDPDSRDLFCHANFDYAMSILLEARLELQYFGRTNVRLLNGDMAYFQSMARECPAPWSNKARAVLDAIQGS